MAARHTRRLLLILHETHPEIATNQLVTFREGGGFDPKPGLESMTYVIRGNRQEVVRPGRFELPTFWFVARRSIQLS
jgi:hypothetical protein